MRPHCCSLNYRYILGSTSHSSANLQIRFLSIFPNNLQYFVKHSTLHRWHVGPRQGSVELSNLTQGSDPNSLLGAVPHDLSGLPRENSQVATFHKDWALWVNVVPMLKHLGFYIFIVLLSYLCHNYKMGHHFAMMPFALITTLFSSFQWPSPNLCHSTLAFVSVGAKFLRLLVPPTWKNSLGIFM